MVRLKPSTIERYLGREFHQLGAIEVVKINCYDRNDALKATNPLGWTGGHQMADVLLPQVWSFFSVQLGYGAHGVVRTKLYGLANAIMPKLEG